LSRDFIYTFNIYLKPGLYQVRVGALDTKTNKTGSANEWIQVPDLTSGKLELSSVMVGKRTQSPTTNASTKILTTQDGVIASVDHRFSNNAYLRFLIFVYNAAVSATDAKPDVALQVQVVRDGQPVVTTPQKKITTDGLPDMKSIPYAAEVPLDTLSTGRYVLQITAVDRVAKTTATQQTRFEIE
jgi:fibronectin type 3 domain-containing protein